MGEITRCLAHTPFAAAAQAAGLAPTLRGFTELAGDDGRGLEIRCSRLPDGGGIWLFSDATERRQMEGRLRQIQHIDSLGNVTGEVAHDFGNILAAVNANVHLLQTGAQKPSPELLLQRISNVVDIGTSLTQRLLAFARTQALVPEVVEINELIERVSELVSIGLKSGVKLETSLAPVPLHVRADPGQLESAILNLCLNSNQAIAENCLTRYPEAKVVITSGRMPRHHRFTQAPHPRVVCISKPLSVEILQESLQ